MEKQLVAPTSDSPKQSPRNCAVEPQAPAAPSNEARRWDSETEFFDRLADRLEGTLAPFSAEQLARYVDRPGRIYEKEFCFRLLGDLRGLRVLDLGCGDGSNSVLLAKRGAEVEAFDLSPRLIELAQRRAELNGVAAQIHFQCAPVERVSFPEAHFGVVWGDGILHHLIDVIEPTLERLHGWAKPGALFVFSEPLSLSPALRRVRLGLPVHTDATPDERPLEARELGIVQSFLPGLKLRHFHAFGRLVRFALGGSDYEGATWIRKRTADALQALDYALLSFPPLEPFGGMAVMWAHRAR